MMIVPACKDELILQMGVTDHPVTGLVIGAAVGGERQSFLLKDISNINVALWTVEKLVAGTNVKVVLGQHFGGLTFECAVVWTVGCSLAGYSSTLRMI